jgi:hypothetical protein
MDFAVVAAMMFPATSGVTLAVVTLLAFFIECIVMMSHVLLLVNLIYLIYI